ncbi:phage major capsid protein [Macrococcoides caseolyticum]|uniref:phage major capsid protein n=1 Tax=Macrococcoides caseolyticum TaxID=69966 RepID=UPI001F3C722B|nr:phage major capsid protein [Macrococcus caseolyticus]MCE4957261.1 phage major capsid protein [Macrococcus caseolyticus]
MTQEEIKLAIEEKQAQLDAKTNEADEAIKAENAELAKSLLEEAKAIQAEIDELNHHLEKEETEKVQEERSEESQVEEVVESEEKIEVEKVVTDLEDKITLLQEDVNKLAENLKTNGETRDMTNIVETVELGQENEVRAAFEQYVMTGEKREGLTTESGAIIVPTEIAEEVVDYSNDVSALANLVQVKKVSNGQGEVAFFDGTSAPALTAVAELEQNPMLGIQPIKKAPFKVETYRGYFPVSQESIEDGIGAVELVKSILNESVVATQNKLILDVLNTQTDNAVADLDALKKLVNVDLAPKYRKQVVLSQTAYNTVDTYKDGNGRYLLQDSISSASGKQLFGMPVTVVEDELIGAGVGYVGDLAGAVGLVDRSRYDLQWTSYMQFAECLMVAVRLDAIALNPNAVKKVTFAPTV